MTKDERVQAEKLKKAQRRWYDCFNYKKWSMYKGDNERRYSLNEDNMFQVFFKFEWNLFNFNWEFGHNDTYFTLNISFIFFNFYFSITNWSFYRKVCPYFLDKRKNKRYESHLRTYGLRMCSDQTVFTWGYDESGMDDNSGYEKHICHERLFLGKRIVKSAKGKGTTIDQEVSYNGIKTTVNFTTYSTHQLVTYEGHFWSCFWPHKHYWTTTVNCDHQFMRQGKGENGWDCEDDYVMERTYDKLMSQAKCIDAFMGDAQEDLHRYGTPMKESVIKHIPYEDRPKQKNAYEDAVINVNEDATRDS